MSSIITKEFPLYFYIEDFMKNFRREIAFFNFGKSNFLFVPLSLENNSLRYTLVTKRGALTLISKQIEGKAAYYADLSLPRVAEYDVISHVERNSQQLIAQALAERAAQKNKNV